MQYNTPTKAANDFCDHLPVTGALGLFLFDLPVYT
jgi:hypothetical protein